MIKVISVGRCGEDLRRSEIADQVPLMDEDHVKKDLKTKKHLVGGLEYVLFSICWESSSQLTNIFQRC